MRRLLAIALFAALPAAAQIHGVPASVTSLTPGRPPHGVPASVTSLGPHGYVDPVFRRPPVDPMFRPSVDPMFGRHPVDPMFRNPSFGSSFGAGSGLGGRFGSGHPGSGRHPHDGDRRRHHHHFYPAYYYPYYGYPAVYTAPEPANEEYAEEAPAEYSRDEERYGEHYSDYREAQRRQNGEEARQAEEDRRRGEEARKAEAAEAARREAQPQDQEPVTVLVFKDGHRQDLRGYAITGNVLYDLSDGRTRRIQLADLDLPATVKLNDELGNDFRLPSRPPRN